MRLGVERDTTTTTHSTVFPKYNYLKSGSGLKQTQREEEEAADKEIFFFESRRSEIFFARPTHSSGARDSPISWIVYALFRMQMKMQLTIEDELAAHRFAPHSLLRPFSLSLSPPSFLRKCAKWLLTDSRGS